MKKLIQIKQKNLAKMRRLWHTKQNEVCPLLGIKIPYDKTSVDHKHRIKGTTVGENGCGLIRGVIHIQANSFEGKVTDSFIRYGLHKFIDLPTFLRNLADYLENPPLGYRFIHPSEIKKNRILKKTSFNKLNKLFKERYPKRKPLEYPKSKKLTKFTLIIDNIWNKNQMDEIMAELILLSACVLVYLYSFLYRRLPGHVFCHVCFL